jgi:hypothetical protein
VGFLSPLFLIGLVAGAVPILLHLFRQQAGPVVPFTAVRFVPRVPMHRTRRRQIQDVLLLALRVAAVALLAVAFARPYYAGPSGRAEGPVSIIAIDRSFSMSAPGRIEAARALASRAVDDAPAGSRVAIIGFDERAEVLVPPTPDRAEARRAVAGVSAGFSATRFDTALSVAAELAGSAAGRLVLVSDLQPGGLAEGAVPSAPESLAIETRIVSAAPGNLLVAAVRRASDGVDAEVRSSARSMRTARVSLSVEGRPSGERQVAVPPGGSAEVSFPIRLPGRAGVAVRVEDAEGYSADNVRYAVMDAAPRRRLLVLVNPGQEGDAVYLTKAVAAAEGPDGLVVDRATPASFAVRPAHDDGHAAIAIMGSRGFDARARAALERSLQRGSGLLIVGGAGIDWPWLVGQLPAPIKVRAVGVEALTNAVSLAATDIRHPIFQVPGADAGWVGAARFRRIVRFSLGGSGRVLARFTNGAPALLEFESGPGRTLLFASDLSNGWNDFPLQPAFVPFVHALVRHVSAARPLREVFVGARPGAEWMQPGVVSPAGEPSARVAVNVDLRESEGLQMDGEAFAASLIRTGSAERTRSARIAQVREREQSWWWYALLLMLVGLLVESAVSRGRRAGAQA